METLKKALHASVVRELMEQYDSRKKVWTETHGTDAGFDTWFTKQVKGESLDCDTCGGSGKIQGFAGHDEQPTTWSCPDCQ